MGWLLMTRFTLQEALRRRLFLAIAILSLLMLIFYALLLHIAIATSLTPDSLSGANPQLFLFTSGIFVSLPTIWLVHMTTGLLTIFLSANMISGEIEAGTFAIIVPKPLRRGDIVLGKWLGNALILVSYTALLFCAFLGIIYWQTGYWPTQALNGLGELELAVLALLALMTLGSVLLPTIINGAITLILFVSAPIVGFIDSILNVFSSIQGASQVPSVALQNISTVISLIIPTDALWHGASYSLLPTSLLNLLVNQGFSSAITNLPIINGQEVSPVLLVWVVFYCLVLPLLAWWRFQKRDL